MRSVEILTVRATPAAAEAARKAARRLVSDLGNTPNLGARCFVHAAVGTDFAVFLARESEPIPGRGSRLGQTIAEALRAFGRVHHALWIEEENP